MRRLTKLSFFLIIYFNVYQNIFSQDIIKDSINNFKNDKSDSVDIKRKLLNNPHEKKLGKVVYNLF